MSKSNRYSPEVRERAARVLFEHEKEYRSRWSAKISIAGEIGRLPLFAQAEVEFARIAGGRYPTQSLCYGLYPNS